METCEIRKLVLFSPEEVLSPLAAALIAERLYHRSPQYSRDKGLLRGGNLDELPTIKRKPTLERSIGNSRGRVRFKQRHPTGVRLNLERAERLKRCVKILGVPDKTVAIEAALDLLALNLGVF